MKELKEFTVERLEELIDLKFAGVLEVVDLAKIALTAKQARPNFDEWLSSLDGTIEVDCGCVTTEAFYHWMRVAYESTPPLNHTEQDGWIKCSDNLPEDGQNVVIINAGHGEIYEAATVTRRGPHFFLLDGLEASNYDGGAVVTLSLEATHWMPLPSAPKPEM